MQIIDKFLDSDEYVAQKTTKTQIYLHHTAGGCFTHDTQIKTLSGKSVSIGEIQRGERVWVYGCKPDGTIVPVEGIGLGKTKDVDVIARVTLDNGEVIECTTDHRFMLRDGAYLESEKLTPGMSLMPLHHVVSVEIVHLDTPIPVYDIEVPETSNFALTSGVFVHNSRGDWTISTWNKDARGKIATAFCVSGIDTRNGDATHDGRIWRAFPEECWAYHLGKGMTTISKHSVGIEICNYGYLYKGKDGRFYNYANGLVPDNQVIELSAPFRKYTYWHRYTDKQIDSTYYLLKHLSSKFGIDVSKGLKSLIPSMLNDAFEYNADAVKGAEGVWSHTNVRKDKFDISPQPAMLDMIMSL